jgi:hypothetical protein
MKRTNRVRTNGVGQPEKTQACIELSPHAYRAACAGAKAEQLKRVPDFVGDCVFQARSRQVLREFALLVGLSPMEHLLIGEVADYEGISGARLLREAALMAARGWIDAMEGDAADSPADSACMERIRELQALVADQERGGLF